MVAMSLQNAKSDLEGVIQRTIEHQEETIVVTEEGAVVLVEQTHWNEIIETLNLLRDKRALSALFRSIEERKQGKKREYKTVEEILKDEQI